MKKIIVLTYVAALLNIVACDNFVDVDTPASQLTGSTVFEDPNTVNAAMTEIYSNLRDFGALSGQTLGSTYTLGLYADELTYYGMTMSPEYNNSMIGSSPVAASIWNEGYKQIYSCNAIIEGVNQSASLSLDSRNQFRGEALFVRALMHFYLTSIYGDVPYITTTDYEQNRLVSRNPTEYVYQQIIEDLTEASGLLPQEYVTAERVRPNAAAAHALLSRVYLYHRDWAEASEQASAVINDSRYVWETDIDKVFSKDATTTIFQFIPKLEGNNSNEGALFIFVSGPPPLVSLNESLVGSFEPGDQRRNLWIKDITDGATTWFHPNKYKLNSNTGTSQEYSIVLRLGEQYLIRAEARAMQGDLIGAKQDLNKIRNTCGLADSPALTSSEIFSAVIAERRHELFTESGHRFLDLKRTGNLDDVLSISKPGWDHNDRLWPIPNNELLADPNLNPQNPGY